jgi:hypothetical protein
MQATILRPWLVERLKTLASLRGVKAPSQLNAFASALSGFDDATIDEACGSIERQERAVRKFPPLPELLAECRRAAAHHAGKPSASTHWTVERYRLCKAFDDWMRSEVLHHGKTIEELCAKNKDIAIAWSAWRTQKENGTLNCPGWCDRCEAVRWLVEEVDGVRKAFRCPECYR